MPVEHRRRGFWDRVQHCDPRILYLLFALLMVGLQFRTIAVPIAVPEYVRALYEHIDTLPGDRIVILDSSMDAGWYAEARGTVESVVRHIFERNIPLALYTNTRYYQGQRIGPEIVEELARELGKEYGRDYCFWAAVVPVGGAELQGLARDIHAQVRTDVNGTPLDQIPMMRNVRTIHDVALVYSVIYGWEDMPWIGFVQSVYGTPYAVGTSAISSSTAFPFLDSGQMIGLLPGASGAASYEQLLQAPGTGTRIVAIQSFAVLFVILTIGLGNLAMGLSRIENRRAERRGA